MRNIFLLLYLLIPGILFGQKMPDYGINRVRIIEPDQLIEAEVIPVSGTIHVKTLLTYYWYSGNAIHITQGGFSGKPLNGLYNAYYLNKNLKQQGNFKNGLKTGLWKEWKDDGMMSGRHRWNNGIILPDSTRSIWQRILFWKRKKAKG